MGWEEEEGITGKDEEGLEETPLRGVIWIQPVLTGLAGDWRWRGEGRDGCVTPRSPGCEGSKPPLGMPCDGTPSRQRTGQWWKGSVAKFLGSWDMLGITTVLLLLFG